ncbi:glutaredoxin [Oleidesulfovibrio alaskensis G20]|uniref:Glutaredoxin n=1 Tax=Oleidesulfovibrio alaskensis (strain ATCC BAA-1058 / DSM 17464 / G20) TaxID=207559 RepID=Q315Y1_OLEA2|nr:thioredoxin family protein [Oleidesulfovibrio alaskensis]ABB37265.1 glutaredoxin [Oleidesulfovibrio alaskensis G20]MBG0772554.1 thioredoxin family protein [Oleidesulfovibrio alaskensis]
MSLQTVAPGDLDARIEQTAQGIVLFHKELCPHCKNMEKVLAKFGAKNPDVELLAVDSEADPAVMEAYGVERVPSLVIVRGGRAVYTRTGLMNPKELTTLYHSV